MILKINSSERKILCEIARPANSDENISVKLKICQRQKTRQKKISVKGCDAFYGYIRNFI